MPDIKVLDCTLRDGGYINDWSFGLEQSKKLFCNIDKSGIEYIEIGFLKNCTYNIEKTIFNKIEEINNIVPINHCSKSKIVAMIAYDDFDIDKIVPKTKDIKLDGIRITFKKKEMHKVFNYLKTIKNNGYELFINPTNIGAYNDEELLELINLVNSVNPDTFSIVDTNGILKHKELLRKFNLIENKLSKNISLCFHSHNNLQLSFSNAQHLIEACKNRPLIIDSTVFGMGRGAGNLCTELLTQYINDNYEGKYDIIPILKIIDEQINPIFLKTPWGYSIPYYLAATNHCHPNYAKYLVDKQTVPVEVINKLLNIIPIEERNNYNQALIKQIYLDNFSKVIDDTKTIAKIKNSLENKTVLVLAPGKSINSESEKIKSFISNNNPFIISLNFIPTKYSEDLVFITNLKRFSTLPEYKNNLVITSNIETTLSDNVLNYSSYINNSTMFDNTALMLLKLLIQIEVKEVYFAGFDGFSNMPIENYAKESMLLTNELQNIKSINEVIKKQLIEFSKHIKINFVTKSLLE